MKRRRRDEEENLVFPSWEEKGGRGDFSSTVPPGGEQIKKLLSNHLPVLILMDELVPYLNVVAEAVEQLASPVSGKLFYVRSMGEKYLFSNQPNIKRILLNNMENVKDEELTEAEQELLSKSVNGEKLKVFVWKENASDIPDSEELKLVILKRKDEELMENIKKMKGQSPRNYPNTIFFLYPMESERPGFVNTINRKIAYERIEGDKNLSLSDDQKKGIKGELKKITSGLQDSIRSLYRMVSVPEKDGFKEIDLGVPTYGEGKASDQEVYDKLRSDGEILEKIAPLVIKEKYLSGKEYLSTRQLYQSSLKTPGEPRLIDQEVLSQGIAEGVDNGLFGLGIIKEDGPTCQYFEQYAPATFSDDEILIREPEMQPPPPPPANANATPGDRQVTIEWDNVPKATSYNIYWSTTPGVRRTTGIKIAEVTSPYILTGLDNDTTYYFVITSENNYGESDESNEVSATPTSEIDVFTHDGPMKRVQLRFQVPKGKVANIMGIMNLLHSKFDTLEIELVAKDGEMSEQDYEDKIEEAFMQLGIKLDK